MMMRSRSERRSSPISPSATGICFPRPDVTLPIELKRQLYDMLSSDIARRLKQRKASEDAVLKDFEAARKKRRCDSSPTPMSFYPPSLADVRRWSSQDIRERGFPEACPRHAEARKQAARPSCSQSCRV